MSTSPFLSRVSAAVPSGWRVEPSTAGWIEASPSDHDPPAQGWKLHVSATVEAAGEVLERALPVLVREAVPFKVVATPELLDGLNAAEGGVGQIGKFITAYPPDDPAAVRLGVALDDATSGLTGPPVPTDRRLRADGVVSYRYGAFDARTAPDEWGEPVAVLRRPDGALIPDPRAEAYTAPPWVEDPFVAAGVAEEPRREAIAGRFAIISTMHRSPRGAVHLAADLDSARPCVLKEAWRHAAAGPDGRDATDHLRWEASILERLARDPRFPDVIALVEHRGGLYLAMERAEGIPLSRHVARLRARGDAVPAERIVAWGREIADALGALHGIGLAYRDLTSANVLVGDRIRLVDLELAARIGDASAPAGGTAGYASRQQAAGEPPSVADDVYALGAVLYLLCTGAEPPDAPDPLSLLDRPVRLLHPSIDDGLAAVVARCLDPDPDRRPASASDVVAELDEVARGPAPPPATSAGRDPDVDLLARGTADLLCDLAAGADPEDTAGAVLALAELVAALGEPRHAEGLEGAARRLAEATPEPGGLLSGAGLQTVALLAAARTLDAPELRDAAAGRWSELAAAPTERPDLATGLAGRLRVHLLAFRDTGDPHARAAAAACADRLLDLAGWDDEGPSWPLPSLLERPGPVALGWAHGLAGIIDALLDLHAATGHGRALDVAGRAARRLMRMAISGPNGAVWPDIEGGPPGGMSTWRGAGGIARGLIAAETAAISGAGELATRAGRSVDRAGRSAGPTMALGLAGSIGVLLDLAAASDDPAWRAGAAAHARVLEAFAEDGGRGWRGIAHPLDLGHGVPGIGIALVRLASGRPDPLALEGLARGGPRWPIQTGGG